MSDSNNSPANPEQTNQSADEAKKEEFGITKDAAQKIVDAYKAAGSGTKPEGFFTAAELGKILESKNVGKEKK